MGFKKKILGAISPLYGAITGEGMMGQMLNPSEAAKIAKRAQEEQEAAADAANTQRQAGIAAAASSGMRGATGMKKGGKVSSASSRADGCAQRGKTKGRML
jgi:hypothetical protein